MAKRFLIKAGIMVLTGALITSCVDDNYDLSDIDTTSRITVNDLTVPVNIDPITLGDVIKIDAGSKIQSIRIGNEEFYALSQSGEFSSDAIEIAGVEAKADPIQQTHEMLEKLFEEDMDQSRRRTASAGFTYQMKKGMGSDFQYTAANVDESIVKISSIETAPFRFIMDLAVIDYQHVIETMVFNDLKISLPKGLIGAASTGSYDSSTGIWSLPSLDVSSNHGQIYLTVTGIDFDLAGARIEEDRTLNFSGGLHMEEGTVSISTNGIMLGDQVEFTIDYTLTDIDVKNMSGEIRYELDGLNIDPVSLSDIPDFLKGGETNIELASPQIYLGLNNPLGAIPLDCTTGIELRALRDGLETLSFSPQTTIKIGHKYGVAGPYNFVLAPADSRLTTPVAYSENLEHISFNSLGSLLATPAGWSRHGLPDKIEIELEHPQVPQQRVSKFTIPQTIAAVHGRYDLVAPLALNDGSHIIYSEVRDGWNDGDIDALTITALKLTSHVTNGCPAAVELTVYPIDKEGREIEGAVVRSNRIAADSDTELTIELTGEIRHLDGVRFVAVLENGDGAALAPDQKLTLTDIRATVGGYYEKKF